MRAALGEGGALAPQDGGARVFLFLAGGEVGQVDGAQGIPLALDPQLAQLVGAGGRDHINVDAAGQHPAVLVVGVVAADLGAARRAEEGGGRVGAESGLQPVEGCGVACRLGRGILGRAAVEGGKTGGVDACGQLLFPNTDILHVGILLNTRCGGRRSGPGGFYILTIKDFGPK